MVEITRRAVVIGAVSVAAASQLPASPVLPTKRPLGWMNLYDNKLALIERIPFFDFVTDLAWTNGGNTIHVSSYAIEFDLEPLGFEGTKCFGRAECDLPPIRDSDTLVLKGPIVTLG